MARKKKIVNVDSAIKSGATYLKVRDRFGVSGKRGDKLAKSVVRKSSSVRRSMMARSAKHNVEFNLSQDDMIDMIIHYYGTQCVYCRRIIKLNNMVFDHIVPISRNGPSIKSNMRIICRPCNTRKGSLSEDDFLGFLRAISDLTPDVRKNIMTRLARGIA